jgi:type I restriction enzyme S subunit
VPLKPTWRPWLYALAISPAFQAEIVDRVTGSTGSRQRVTPSEIAILPVVCPPAELIERFSMAVHPALKRKAAMLREALSLSELRDALLPKLMSGELRINGSARIVERATR